MSAAAKILVALVAVEHLWFMTLEMVFWTRPLGLRTFGQTREQAEGSAKLALNQGLYNGFLAAGLLWSLGTAQRPVEMFFLGCVAVAGAVGGITVNPRIALIQALPALIGLGLLIAG